MKKLAVFFVGLLWSAMAFGYSTYPIDVHYYVGPGGTSTTYPATPTAPSQYATAQGTGTVPALAAWVSNDPRFTCPSDPQQCGDQWVAQFLAQNPGRGITASSSCSFTPPIFTACNGTFTLSQADGGVTYSMGTLGLELMFSCPTGKSDGGSPPNCLNATIYKCPTTQWQMFTNQVPPLCVGPAVLKCPNGGTLSGTQCVKYTSCPASYGGNTLGLDSHNQCEYDTCDHGGEANGTICMIGSPFGTWCDNSNNLGPLTTPQGQIDPQANSWIGQAGEGITGNGYDPANGNGVYQPVSGDNMRVCNPQTCATETYNGSQWVTSGPQTNSGWKCNNQMGSGPNFQESFGNDNPDGQGHFNPTITTFPYNPTLDASGPWGFGYTTPSGIGPEESVAPIADPNAYPGPYYGPEGWGAGD